MSKQPVWKYIANLGDVSPLEYGGDFLYIDTTGIYTPELEHYDPDINQYSRILLEKLDNNSWFADELESVADSSGMDVNDLKDMLTSDNPVELAHGYIELTHYYGWFEFDQYPEHITPREAKKRYSKEIKARL